MSTTAIPHDVLRALEGAHVDGLTVRLPGQLDRKTYAGVNAVLESLGGRWNRRAKAHLFPSDPSERFEEVLTTGSFTRTTDGDFFPTPPALAARVVALADIQPGHFVLEPSAGEGALVMAARRAMPDAEYDCIEQSEARCISLHAHGFKATCADFLTLCLSGDHRWYDRIIMNPPFSKQQDVDHVTHAFRRWLMPGGRLVAIMSAGVTFRENRKTVVFRDDVLDAYSGMLEENPPASFRSSGTSVSTVTVVIDKPSWGLTVGGAG